MYPDRVNADGLAKGRSSGWHSRSSEALTPLRLVGREGWCLRSSDIMACAAGRSSIRVVPRTADVKLSKCSSHIALAMIQVYWKTEHFVRAQ